MGHRMVPCKNSRIPWGGGLRGGEDTEVSEGIFLHIPSSILLLFLTGFLERSLLVSCPQVAFQHISSPVLGVLPNICFRFVAPLFPFMSLLNHYFFRLKILNCIKKYPNRLRLEYV